MTSPTVIDSGFVLRNPAGKNPSWMAVGPRVAALSPRELVCSYMRTEKTATNDFVPCLCRSHDGGRTWTDEGPLWPDWVGQFSVFASLSRDAAGRLYAYGSRTRIDVPGETFWSDATQGLKQNELIWSASDDGGRTWRPPQNIPMRIAGSAEAPGPLCVTKSGHWLATYSPYRTFDPSVMVDLAQVVVLRSRDSGSVWQSSSMIRLNDSDSGAAEAWVVELADGRLLATAWHLNLAGGEDRTNKFSLSLDSGETWSPTQSTGILGQSTALAALPDGRALFIYNQRKHGQPGVWIAVVRPTERDFGIESNELVWCAAQPTQHASSGDHSQWSDFSFGEPSAAVMPDGTIYVVLWCLQPHGSGVAFVHLQPPYANR